MITQVALFSLISSIILAKNSTLKFNDNGQFKIVQFTDLHFGENEEYDARTQKVMLDILEREQPDLAVITGDVISDYLWDKVTRPWATVHYSKLGEVFRQQKVTRFASTLGNHDTKIDIDRSQLLEFDMSLDESITQMNEVATSPNKFNYVLPVYSQEGDKIFMRLWFIDTGNKNCMEQPGWDCAMSDQVKWFLETSKKVPEDEKNGFLFMHIPLPEQKGRKFTGNQGYTNHSVLTWQNLIRDQIQVFCLYFKVAKVDPYGLHSYFYCLSSIVLRLMYL